MSVERVIFKNLCVVVGGSVISGYQSNERYVYAMDRWGWADHSMGMHMWMALFPTEKEGAVIIGFDVLFFFVQYKLN